jgi:hypothetical protein
MAFDYAALRGQVAIPLLDEFGKAAALRVAGTDTGSTYNPVPAAPTDHAVVVVETQFTKEERAGGNVQQDDLMFLMSTKGVTINPGLAQQLILDSIAYAVIHVGPLRPGTVIMLWRVHVRK